MNHKTYKIQKGDTLENISKRLDSTPYELRNFHNTHCELNDLIADKLPSHLKEILYLPASEITSQNLTELKKENSLSLILNPSLQKTTYHVSVTSYEGSKENSLSYTTYIQWLKRNLVLLTKEDFLINHKEPGLMAEVLAEKLNSVLYPLELLLDGTGKILGNNNYSEIKSRLKLLKKEIRDFFAGKELEKFIQLNESVISKETDLVEQVKKDWFLHSFFNGIYQDYKVEGNPVSEKYFPLIPSIPFIKYSVETRIKDQQEKQKIKLSFTGAVSDTRTPTDLEKEHHYPSFSEETLTNSLEGIYNSWYVLDYNHYKIDSLFLECSLLLEKEQKVQIRAFQIQEPKTEVNPSSEPDTNRKSFLSTN